MSKTWYPMINYALCSECGACVDKCPNGVYDKEQAPKPVVIYGEGCGDGCKGCGNLCPSGAIEYFGDNGDVAECNCGGGCGCDGDCDCGC